MYYILQVISVDWSLIVVSAAGDDGTAHLMSITKTTRTMRLVRVLRMLRLARVIRGLSTVSGVVQSIQSDYLRTLAGVAALMFAIVFINHYVACGFYYLGSSQPGGINWVEETGVVNESLWYRYMTSLHWSLTQFTPASMEACTVYMSWYAATHFAH